MTLNFNKIFLGIGFQLRGGIYYILGGDGIYGLLGNHRSSHNSYIF